MSLLKYKASENTNFILIVEDQRWRKINNGIIENTLILGL